MGWSRYLLRGGDWPRAEVRRSQEFQDDRVDQLGCMSLHNGLLSEKGAHMKR